jgi:hypothetical protein
VPPIQRPLFAMPCTAIAVSAFYACARAAGAAVRTVKKIR